jgi:hypothetical protein
MGKPATAAPDPDAWTWGSEIDVTNGGADDLTSITILSGLSAGITDIEIFTWGLGLGTVTDVPRVQLGDSGGFETTGYDSCVTLTSSGDQDTSGFQLEPETGGSTSAIWYQVYRIARVFPGEHSWIFYGTANIAGADGIRYGFGTKTLSGELTQVRMNGDGSSGTATFDEGSVIARYM